MVERAIPQGKLLAFIVQNDDDERFIMDEFRRQRFNHINLYTIKNTTPEPLPLTDSFLQQFSNLGMQGYLASQIECPLVVKAFLDTFCSFNTIFWVRQQEGMPRFDAEHEHMLCAGNPKLNSLKVYIEQLSVQRGRGDVSTSEIEEHIMSKSKFAIGGMPSINTNTVRVGRLLGADGEEVADKRAELEQRIAHAKAARLQLEGKARQRQVQLEDIVQQIAELKSTRTQLHQAMRLPREVNALLATAKRRRDDIRRRLEGDIVKMRETNQIAYADAIEALIHSMKDVARVGLDYAQSEGKKSATAIADENC
jgi:hypothetical protein